MIHFFFINFLTYRTFISIVPVPLVDTVVAKENKPIQCEILHHGECSCWVGHLYNQTKELQETYHRIQTKMQIVEKEVAEMKEFRGLREFAVVYQPFTTGISVIIYFIIFILNILILFEISSLKQISRIMIYPCWHLIAFI